MTYKDREQQALLELAVQVVGDPSSDPEDRAEARRRLVGAEKLDHNKLTSEQRDQLREILRAMLGHAPVTIATPKPCARCGSFTDDDLQDLRDQIVVEEATPAEKTGETTI